MRYVVVVEWIRYVGVVVGCIKLWRMDGSIE